MFLSQTRKMGKLIIRHYLHITKAETFYGQNIMVEKSKSLQRKSQEGIDRKSEKSALEKEYKNKAAT